MECTIYQDTNCSGMSGPFWLADCMYGTLVIGFVFRANCLDALQRKLNKICRKFHNEIQELIKTV